MPDKPPLDSPEPPDPTDLPPAAQWMLAQATAAQNEPPERAAAALVEWGAAMGRHVVAETDGLDDAAAEELLQTRVRAVRQLMVSVARAAADPPPPGATPLADVLRGADVVYGQHYAAPGRDAVGRALAHWAADAGRPAEQIAGLRAFIEGQLRSESEVDTDAATA